MRQRTAPMMATTVALPGTRAGATGMPTAVPAATWATSTTTTSAPGTVIAAVAAFSVATPMISATEAAATRATGRLKAHTTRMPA